MMIVDIRVPTILRYTIIRAEKKGSQEALTSHIGLLAFRHTSNLK